MKVGISCTLVINSSWGYIFEPIEFPSINQAVKYARSFRWGYAWRLFDKDGKVIRKGFCDSSPWNGYRGI